MTLTRKQKTLLGDITIATAMLVLAYMLKGADTEAQHIGMTAIAVAILLRFNNFKSNTCATKDTQCGKE